MLLHTGYTSSVASKQLETQQESDAEQLESNANAQAIQNETKAGESRAAGGGCCLRTFISICESFLLSGAVSILLLILLDTRIVGNAQKSAFVEMRTS